MNEVSDGVKVVLGTMTFGESVFYPEVGSFIKAFYDAGYDEIDTAFVYNEGECERLVGKVLSEEAMPNLRVSTKVNPRISGRLDDEAAYFQLNESLKRLGIESADTFYLHFPDRETPVISVLGACQSLFEEKKFKRLGLSNFPAWKVADVWHICHENNWVLPEVYEGIYNPLTRNAERELNETLDHFGMCFYAYNPLAGGLMSGKYTSFEAEPSDGRFTHRPNYQARYWKKSFFEAVDHIKTICEKNGVSVVEATLRWLKWHSMLNAERGDAIIIGASKLNHLKQNLEALERGPLSDDIAEAFEDAWRITRPDSPEYFTYYSRPVQ